MSSACATALAACISSPNCPSSLSHIPIWRSSSLRPPPPTLSDISFKIPCGSFKRSSSLTGFRTHSPVMQWQDCTVKMEIDVPISVAYDCYSDREAIPRWMPFISTVKILEDKPDLSRWSLKYKAFGVILSSHGLLEICSLYRIRKSTGDLWKVFLTEVLSGFIQKLTVSYEVPPILAPVASALQPFLESLLGRGLERFATFSKSYKSDSTV
ncbi:uncharacterized protein Pyn_17207 [Prunus yedoensis var. nudiflora]|uniref:Coenzyme Q-binding protein COQ10 START domain-containing protein n=1 Tax=Prunus yedoensis var. nudiflora TaxID=2094558 RepID=A0A314UGD3_PRUYE|nr:uncharacterized protein Pyn_17207 [Prunus yedoensis var. nudiflora]